MSTNSFNRTLSRWLLWPEPNAAGHLGGFRVVYALFYLAYVAGVDYRLLAEMPRSQWRPVPPLIFFDAPPPVAVIAAAELALVGALVLLLVGLWSRPATGVVLLAGGSLYAVQSSFGDIAHNPAFLVLNIPAVMLFAPWGACYALGAPTTTDPTDSSLRYSWPIKLLLLILSVQFTMGGYIKMVMGVWLVDWETIPKLVISHHLSTPTLNPLALWAASYPALGVAFQVGGILFEALFFLALVNRPLRLIFVGAGVVFHWLNSYLLGFSFGLFNIIYLLFLVDWHMVFSRFGARLPRRLPAWLLAGCALLVTLGWYPLLAGWFEVLPLSRWITWGTQLAALVAFGRAAWLLWPRPKAPTNSPHILT